MFPAFQIKEIEEKEMYKFFKVISNKGGKISYFYGEHINCFMHLLRDCFYSATETFNWYLLSAIELEQELKTKDAEQKVYLEIQDMGFSIAEYTAKEFSKKINLKGCVLREEEEEEERYQESVCIVSCGGNGDGYGVFIEDFS